MVKKIFFVSTLMIMLMATLFYLMMENKKKMKENKTSFECGFNPIIQKKMTFSTNFLLMMMMFLIFDVEVSFLIPSIMMNKSSSMIMMSCMSFLAILAAIILKEWTQGSLEWNK